jgi:hypothetical protein
MSSSGTNMRTTETEEFQQNLIHHIVKLTGDQEMKVSR